MLHEHCIHLPAMTAAHTCQNWRGYRLADMLSSVWFRHSAGGMGYHQMHFPGSLVDIFLSQYHSPALPRSRFPGSAFRAINATHPLCSTRAGCPTFVPPIAALVHMLRAGSVARCASVDRSIKPCCWSAHHLFLPTCTPGCADKHAHQPPPHPPPPTTPAAAQGGVGRRVRSGTEQREGVPGGWCS